MAYPHDLYCPTDPNAPVPPGICDACGAKFYLHDLEWQYDWAGNNLVNLHLRHCFRCLDEPNPQRRPPLIIGPDPVPVKDPRPPRYPQQMVGTGPQLPTSPPAPGGGGGGGGAKAGKLDFSDPGQSAWQTMVLP